MKSKYNFDIMQSELVSLKDRIKYINQAMEDLPPDIKAKLMVQTSELHTLVEELTLKIDELKKTSTSDWISKSRSSTTPQKPS